MKMKLIWGISLLLALAASSYAATCNYYRWSDTVTCGGVTCDAVGNVGGGGKLPSGYYYIGVLRINTNIDDTPWFNLYKQWNNGTRFWDYYTNIPEEGCRGRFGLHPGTRSLGCITVTDRSCFDQLSEVINSYGTMSFTVTRCDVCVWGRCISERQRSASYSTDLQVH